MIDLGAHYIPDPEDLTRPAADRANDVIIIGWQRAPTKGDAERIQSNLTKWNVGVSDNVPQGGVVWVFKVKQ